MHTIILLIAFTLAGSSAAAFLLIVTGIRIEDDRRTITGRPPGFIAAGTRRILHLYVDHTVCRYASNPQHACPSCRRLYVDR
ncbi:hypothetical protein [Sphaerimonospora thailandensis]|uniref:Uncharacterized protein n=1 Tax=Sphaerimonospora thailandensis TaxID=795644 RepID=A0A8J3RC20_9ACTN|nr:hypothetical protein [Sphaerimonospora thailandensis]GIH72952.1 hypothetical protein Mth01_52050 [Sphaerimonospora thailandensis]